MCLGCWGAEAAASIDKQENCWAVWNAFWRVPVPLRQPWCDPPIQRSGWTANVHIWPQYACQTQIFQVSYWQWFLHAMINLYPNILMLRYCKCWQHTAAVSSQRSLQCFFFRFTPPEGSACLVRRTMLRNFDSAGRIITVSTILLGSVAWCLILAILNVSSISL